MFFVRAEPKAKVPGHRGTSIPPHSKWLRGIFVFFERERELERETITGIRSEEAWRIPGTSSC
jgi:hypothetical protein